MVAAIEAPIVLMCKLGAFIFPQNHWILYERGTDARDNGYWFYKYLKDNHPEIKVFYLISKDSVDYPKVQADAVVFGTVKHYWLLVSAAKRISTHYAFGLRIPNAILFRFYGLHNNFYFLQHGIT